MVATRTQTILSPTVTQLALADAIKAAFVALGYSSVDDYISGTDRLLVFSLQQDATKTYGTIFLRCRITTALAVSQTIGVSFNSTTKALTNESSAAAVITFGSTTEINLITYANGSQYRLVTLNQGTGTSTTILGIFRPTNKPSWWDEGVSPYAFIAFNNNNTNLKDFVCANLPPFTSMTGAGIESSSRMTNPNPITGKRDLLPNLPLYTSTSHGICGNLPEDFALVCGSGSAKLDILEVSSTEKYEFIYSGANPVVVRIV